MRPGQILASRFQIERLAGRGGMGEVHRALDLETGTAVALKVLGTIDPDLRDRLSREARLLQRLAHPGVVRFVGHGEAPGYGLYLAMEWLDGEDLAARLARGPLTAGETLAIALGVSEALGAVHAAGVLHRDLKPSNLFLPGGRCDAVRILDFGLARRPAASLSATRADGFLGTAGYVAPEQVRGDRSLTPAADVFSLGCVLYECLAGRPAFAADHVLAVLARVMFDEPEPLERLCDDLPAGLGELVDAMLAKEPSERPADGAALHAAWRAIAGPVVERPAAEPAAPGLTAGEQRIVSAVMVAGGRAPLDVAGEIERLRDELARFGARIEPLATDALMVVLQGGGSGLDRAALAARCALRLRGLLPDARLSLSSGRARVEDRLPVGEVADSALRMLERADPGGPIRVDETSVGLLDARFEIGSDGRGLVVSGEVEAGGGARRLLGHPAPFVGRRRELDLMRDLARECIEDGVAQALLVTGEAGMGKSRLRQEFLDALEADGLSPGVWLGRADALGSGSPFGLIASLVRSAAGLRVGDPVGLQEGRLRARIGRHVASDQVARVAAFVGEAAGIRFADEAHESLRAARADPRLMGERIGSAFGDWLDAETAAGPVLLVLDDAHWGDVPSMRLLDAVLGRLHARPLMVAAFARPEVRQTFPDLWAERSGHVVRLAELRPRECVELVRRVLGAETPDDRADRLARRSGGNPLALEELLRMAVDGREDAAPATVVAMVQDRLESLDSRWRRVLRAASVFGESFWLEGLARLVGEDAAADGEEPLRVLIQAEAIVSGTRSRFPGVREYHFRHAIVRDAAYGMLTEEDRRLGHRLAAEWLEASGESDATVLATHFDLGGVPERALIHLHRAAMQRLVGNDLEGVIRVVEQAMSRAPGGAMRAGLLLLRARAHMWRGEHEREREALEQGLAAVAADEPVWTDLTGQLLQCCTAIGAGTRARALAAEVLATGDRIPGLRRGPLLARAIESMMFQGCAAESDALLAELDRIPPEQIEEDLSAAALVDQMRSHRALQQGDLEDCAALASRSASRFDRSGNSRSACVMRATTGYALTQLGLLAEAERELGAALEEARRAGMRSAVGAVGHNLGWVRALRGDLEAARRMEEEVLREAASGRLRIGALIYSARIARLAGEPALAERHAAEAIAASDQVGPLQAYALAALAELLCDAGRREEALAACERAIRIREETGPLEEGEALMWRVHGDALAALDRHDEARAAWARGRSLIEERAARIRAAATREAFLTQLPDCRIALERARASED